MTPERWKAIDRVWQAVLAHPAHERAAAIVDLSEGDEGLQHDVQSLFEHLERASAAGFGRGALAVRVPPAALVGQQLGPYTVLGLLGVGGMGEVYRARDATLGREVALKILPTPWLTDPDRQARFAREARLLASLNHPNIGAIYGVHESDTSTGSEPGARALVLELVGGETLGERIARQAAPDGTPRGLPIDAIVSIAGQLTAALEAAHERGIVHRDLKPANIKITPDGRVKVLDFGLARAVSVADSALDIPFDDPSRVSATHVGLLLGTATYMSPEQARGRAVDRRSDIWAFGCILYEMLTGKTAFGGADIAETLAHVIRDEPEWSALPPDTPTALRVCLRRCLQKDVADRIHDAADVRLAMHGAFEEQDSPRTRRARNARIALTYGGWVVAAIVAATAVIVPALRRGKGSSEASHATPPVLLRPLAGGGEGSATAATIQEAIDKVAPGGTVQMLPGVYTEALRITKGLTLEASGDRTGSVVIAPPKTAESAIVIETTEPVTIRAITVHVSGTYGVRGVGSLNLTIERATILAVDPPPGKSRLLEVTTDASRTGSRSRIAVRTTTLDGAVAKRERLEARPQNTAIALWGDVDGLIEGNIIRRTGDICLTVQTRDDLGGVTNVDIVNNDIDQCHPLARVSSILVGSPPIARLSPERHVSASGMVNIIGNTIRNSSEDCLTSAIAYDVFAGRIERNRIVNFVQPCARLTTRNHPGAIWIGLRVTGIQMPAAVPSVRFNDIHGNASAGLRIGENQTLRIDASCNYWGSDQGPSGIGPGNGDVILVEPGAPAPVFVPFAKTPIAHPAGRC